MAKFNSSPEQSQPAHRLAVGEQLTWTVKDDAGNIITTSTLTRTNRPYAEDVCDVYNKNRKRDDLEYYVDRNGEIRLGFSSRFERQNTDHLRDKAEQDRRDWKRAQIEARNANQG